MKNQVKQKFQLGDTVHMIDSDYNFFEGTIINIRLEHDGNITYSTEEVDFTESDLDNWVFESEMYRELHLEAII